MLRINRKNIWHDRDSNPERNAWEHCCPNHTAVIYFWIKRVGSFGQIKKRKMTLLKMNNFSCILHILRKIKNVKQQLKRFAWDSKISSTIWWFKDNSLTVKMLLNVLKERSEVADVDGIWSYRITSCETRGYFAEFIFHHDSEFIRIFG